MSGRILLAAGLLSAFGLSCSQNVAVVPVRNVDRPSDLGFVCAGPVEGKTVVSGRPMIECHDPLKSPLTDPRGNPPTLGSFGLFTNTSSSSVGGIDFDQERLVDLDFSTPGYNMVPVGTLPEAISVSDDGCQAVTANRGSCDLSVIDVSSVFAATFGLPSSTRREQAAGSPSDAIAHQVRLHTANGGELRVAPYEIAMLPTEKASVVKATDTPSSADGGAPADAAVPVTTTTTAPACRADRPARSGNPDEHWRAVVTLPGCNLVALVELPSGKVLSSLHVLPDGGTVDAGPNPVCPVECGWGPNAPAPADAGVAVDAAALADASVHGDASADARVSADSGAGSVTPDGGAPGDGGPGVSTSIGPLGVSALVVMPSGFRMYVGAPESPVISAIGIVGNSLISLEDAGKIPLSENAGGVTRLRLSVDPFGPTRKVNTGPEGPFVGDQGKYLYAFARDASVRVLDVSQVPAVREQECDVNVDPAAFTSGDTASGTSALTKICFPVGGGRARIPLANGPGIRLPQVSPSVAPPIPMDIAFTQLGDSTTGSGYTTALLLSSNGNVYHLSLASPPSAPQPNNSYRAAPIGQYNTLGVTTVPYVYTTPVRTFSTPPVAFPTEVLPDTELAGPRFEVYDCSSSAFQSLSGCPDGTSNAIGTTERWMEFPHPSTTGPETLALSWEGALAGTFRYTGHATTTTFNDVGADFCGGGVEPGDVVALLGCTQDLDCDPRGLQVCYRAAPGAAGVCLPKDFAADPQKLRDCNVEFSSRRRYEVTEVNKASLGIKLKLDEVARPDISPCTIGTPAAGSANVCQPDLAHAPDPTRPGDLGFQCLAVSGQPRCVRACGSLAADGKTVVPDDTLCRPGFVCADGVGAAGPLCVEAPPPSAACQPLELRYQIQVGRGYLFRSDSVPFFPTRREVGGRCVTDTQRSKLFTSRISLSAPACKPTTAPIGNTSEDVLANALRTGVAGEGPGGSPCLFVGANSDDPTSLDPHVKALFENPHVRFVFTNLEQYVGDSADLTVQLQGGFTPLPVVTLQSGAATELGVRILTGPMRSYGTAVTTPIIPPYLFVVDQAKSNGGSRGQIDRINPQPVDIEFGGIFDSLSSLPVSLFPIQ